MKGINKVILLGNLGNDPKKVTFQNGGSIVTFSLATSRSYKNPKTQAVEEATEWHNIVTNNKLAEIAEKYLHKGDSICLEGGIRYKKYTDKAGVEKQTTEIQAYEFVMTGKSMKKSTNDEQQPSSNANNDPLDLPF
jgi:single-strand DNA-binding protein